MPFNIKQRGKLTYYYEGDDPVLSNMVVETLPDGDLRICFSGLTGGYSATGILKLDTVATMEPEIEIPARLPMLGNLAARGQHLQLHRRCRLHRDARLRRPAQIP